MILDVLFTIAAVSVSIPVFVFALEIIRSIVPQNSGLPTTEDPTALPSTAVLVPAHNEAAIFSRTLAQICSQIPDPSMILVVADNCEDNTAEIARSAGATVLERIDPENRGKGFALDFGVQFLEQNPPDVVVMIDADCYIGPGLIERISTLAFVENKPVQALYLMEYSENKTELNKRISQFAWRVKNHARPLGLKLLHMPCQLMGTGMAIPFIQLRKVKLNSANIVEDMKMGIDLATAGHPPLFHPSVRVTSHFPESGNAAEKQRKRWEHGHIGIIINEAPRVLLKSIVNRDMQLFGLAMDLIVPPLSLLAILVLTAFVVSAVMMYAGTAKAVFYLCSTTLFVFICSVIIAWLGYGRDLLSFREILWLPVKMIAKLPLYIQFLINRQKNWIKTKRD